jgi:hypothetical protein
MIGNGWAELQVGRGTTAASPALTSAQTKLNVQATLTGQAVPVEVGQGGLRFGTEITISAGQTLVLRWEE